MASTKRWACSIPARTDRCSTPMASFPRRSPWWRSGGRPGVRRRPAGTNWPRWPIAPLRRWRSCRCASPNSTGWSRGRGRRPNSPKSARCWGPRKRRSPTSPRRARRSRACRRAWARPSGRWNGRASGRSPPGRPTTAPPSAGWPPRRRPSTGPWSRRRRPRPPSTRPPRRSTSSPSVWRRPRSGCSTCGAWPASFRSASRSGRPCASASPSACAPPKARARI